MAAIILLVLLLAEKLASRHDDRRKRRRAIVAGNVLAACVLVAGLCDYIENWQLGALLRTPPGSLPSSGAVWIASWSASLKFTLLGLAALFCVAVAGTSERVRHAASLLQRLWMRSSLPSR